MNESDHYLCKGAKNCRYGVTFHGGKSICDYIGETGISRLRDPVKGEIVNGKCGYYEDWSDVRTGPGAKDRSENKRKKRFVY